MGVKLLAKLLKTQCYDVSEQVHLSCLYGKKICIDVSIYLYRYKSQNALIENFYLMCSLFKRYNITPIFVFDGKPPKEKRKELDERREARKEAYRKYEELVGKCDDNITYDQKIELKNLKRKMLKIKREDVELVQNLFDAYGIKYMTAIGEADILCASLVLKKKVYAVLTEDMDLFAYTSPIVLRYFSLLNHTCILYDLKKILKKLDIDKTNFQIVCVLSGNDYYNSKKNIFYYLRLFNKYKKRNENINFMDWIEKNNYLSTDEIEEVNKVLKMYMDVKKELTNYNYFIIKTGSVDKEKLYNILEGERFVF